MKRLFGFLLFFWSLHAAAGADNPAPQANLPLVKPEIVGIDCGTGAGPFLRRGSGFLLSVSATEPSDDLLDPLRPTLFRTRAVPWDPGPNQTGLAGAQRMARLGATVELIVSDDYSVDRLIRGKPVFPVDFATLDGTIKRLVGEGRTAGFKPEWDLWNEPDGEWMGGMGGPGRFREAWLYAYRKLRELDPGAVIVGPSTIHYEACRDFLPWAEAQNVLPDIITWHENDDAPQKIPAHAAEIRRILEKGKIKPRPLVCNEITGPSRQTDAGLLVWYFAALERAGIAGACHSCWTDADGKTSNGFNQSLDGILAPEHQPRAPWWAYRYYADFQGESLRVHPARTVDGVAASDDQNHVLRLLLGANGRTQASDVIVRLMDLPRRLGPDAPAKVHIQARKISAGGWQPLPEPPVSLEADYPVSAALSVRLPSLGPAECYYLTVSWGDL